MTNSANITITPFTHTTYNSYTTLLVGEFVWWCSWVGDVDLVSWSCCLGWGVVFGGGRDFWSRTICITNRQNTGLISVDRKTSLLSHVQYPVLYQSRLQRI